MITTQVPKVKSPNPSSMANFARWLSPIVAIKGPTVPISERMVSASDSVARST